MSRSRYQLNEKTFEMLVIHTQLAQIQFMKFSNFSFSNSTQMVISPMKMDVNIKLAWEFKISCKNFFAQKPQELSIESPLKYPSATTLQKQGLNIVTFWVFHYNLLTFYLLKKMLHTKIILNQILSRIFLVKRIQTLSFLCL